MPESENIDLSKLKIHRERSSSPEEKSPRRTRWIVLIASLAGISLIAFLILNSVFSRSEEVEISSVRMISPSQARSLLTASGYVVAQRKASIASKATGRLIELRFEEGDKVRKGEIIGRIESEDVQAALEQAQANLELARAEQLDAERTLRRANQLYERDLISQAELDAAQSRFDKVTAGISAASASVRAAEVQLENTLIRAPFAGTVLTKNADVGEVVAPFAAGASSRVAVVTIADMSSLEVEADVSESNIEKIVVGQKCEIILDAYPEKRYSGVVSKVVPTADRAKATVLTKVKFTDRDDRVLPEMSSKVYFLPADSTYEESTASVLAVDASAIAERDGKRIVFVVRDDKAIEVPIQTGDSFGGMVEVRNGLADGDRVIVSPSMNLETGSPVLLKTE